MKKFLFVPKIVKSNTIVFEEFSVDIVANVYLDSVVRVAATKSVASPECKGDREGNCELSEEGQIALALRYAWVIPPGKERLPEGVGSNLAVKFGVGERYSRIV